ncbi:MAG: DUF2795 domain-containing protein [Bradymonadaceae bacterium]
MGLNYKRDGNYELFETTKGHRILVLDETDWAAWVEGQAGEILVATDEDHEKQRTIDEGSYRLIDFENDPKFKDMPHLFLATDGSYRELMLPNGWPDEKDRQKKVIETDKTMTRDELDEYLASGPPEGPGEERMRRPGGGSMANVTHHLKGFDYPGKPDALIEHARDNGAPDEVIEQLETLPSRSYQNMADVTREIGEQKEELPIENYDDLSAREAKERVHDLSGHDLELVEAHERDNLNRTSVLEAIEAKKSPGVPDDYDLMKADQVKSMIEEAPTDQLEAIESFEREHLDRQSVLRAIGDRKQRAR